MKRYGRGFSLDWLSKYYDLVTRAERSRYRRKQIELSGIRPGEKVLDVGCGTGSLAILARIAVGDDGETAGIDIAANMISTAQRKAERAGLDIDFRVASIDNLPYPDGCFDVVTSTMMFHHLPVEIKARGLREVHRVLKADGRFFLCDFLAPHPLAAPLMFLPFVWMPSTRYQLFGKLPNLIRECGFTHLELIRRGAFLTCYRAGKLRHRTDTTTARKHAQAEKELGSDQDRS
jgi:ubiquinone/menaquinone biosynthesis C-methylase UbiE